MMKSYLKTVHPKKKSVSKFAHQFSKWVFKDYFKGTGKILSVGCGQGDYLEGFKKLGFDCYGCDIEPVNEGIEKVNLENDDFPWPNCFFDYVFCKSIIEHLENPHKMFDEIHRVLKPKGKLFILTDDWKRCMEDFYGKP